MANSFHVLIAVILVIGTAAVMLSPRGTANNSGFAVLAHDRQSVDSYFENGDLKPEYVNLINLNTKNVPDQLFEMFGSDKINIYITYNDGTTQDYYAITEKNRLKELRKGARNDAAIEIRFAEKTISRLMDSEKSFDDFIEAMNSGEIKYKGLNIGGSIKQASVNVSTNVIGIISKAVNFFAGLFG